MDVLYLAGIQFVKWRSCGFNGWALTPRLVAVISHFTMCLEMMARKDMQLIVSQVFKWKRKLTLCLSQHHEHKNPRTRVCGKWKEKKLSMWLFTHPCTLGFTNLYKILFVPIQTRANCLCFCTCSKLKRRSQPAIQPTSRTWKIFQRLHWDTVHTKWVSSTTVPWRCRRGRGRFSSILYLAWWVNNSLDLLKKFEKV